MNVDAPLTYTVREAAAVLGVTHVTVYSEITAGRLRALTVDGKKRVSRTALDDWIRAREEEHVE